MADISFAPEVEDKFEGIFFGVSGATLRTLVHTLLESTPSEKRLAVLQDLELVKEELPEVLTYFDLEEGERWRIKAMLPLDVKPDQLDNFQFTDESLYSVTQSYHRKIINGLISKWTQLSDKRPLKQLTITDATAHVGGDSMGFGLEGYGKVQSVEISYLVFNILIENLELFGLDSSNVFHSDYTQIYETLKQDIIFIDAPWGGREVMDKKDISLNLGEWDLNELAEDILTKNLCTVLVLKVPPGYKSLQLPSKLKEKYGTEDREIKTKDGKVKFRVIGYYINPVQSRGTGGTGGTGRVGRTGRVGGSAERTSRPARDRVTPSVKK